MQPSKTRDICLLFILVLGVLIFRRPDTFTTPQFWAEDSMIIFNQAEALRAKSLITPYAGYLFMLPRLLAFFFSAMHFRYLYIPTLYNYSAFVFTFLVALGLYNSACYLKIRHKLIYATWFLFMPVYPDLYMVMGSLGWMTGIYLINYIFVQNEFKKSWAFYLHTLVLFIISLTHPHSTLFSPIIVLLLFMERKTLNFRKILPLCTILAGGIIQLISIKFIDKDFYRGQPGNPEPNHFFHLFANNVRQLFFFDMNVYPDMSLRVQNILAMVILAALAVLFVVLYRRVENKRKYVLVLAAIISFASFIQAYWPKESFILALTNSRYYFVPYCCIGWICILALDDKIKLQHIATYFVFFFLHSNYMRYTLPDRQWKRQIREFYEHKRDVIEINPEGWQYVPDRSKLRKTY